MTCGAIENISSDAIELPANPTSSKDGKDRTSQPGLVYAARIRIDDPNLKVAGKNYKVGPGLAVQAEIKTGYRRIIQYLLSPLSQRLKEAGGER